MMDQTQRLLHPISNLPNPTTAQEILVSILINHAEIMINPYYITISAKVNNLVSAKYHTIYGSKKRRALNAVLEVRRDQRQMQAQI